MNILLNFFDRLQEIFIDLNEMPDHPITIGLAWNWAIKSFSLGAINHSITALITHINNKQKLETNT